MTPLEQAEAILKAAEEIVALEKRIGLKLDMAEYIEPDDYDGEEIDEANTLALAYAGRIALALIEKHRALEDAEARLALLESVLAEAGEALEPFRKDCEEWKHYHEDGRSEWVIVLGRPDIERAASVSNQIAGMKEDGK